jgi:hypothetical protein
MKNIKEVIVDATKKGIRAETMEAIFVAAATLVAANAQNKTSANAKTELGDLWEKQFADMFGRVSCAIDELNSGVTK